MTELPQELFANPIYHALTTRHSHLGVSVGAACRYLADVAPFAAVVESSTTALQQLHSLLTEGESVWVMGENYPRIAELLFEERLECLQMVLPAEVLPATPAMEIVPLFDVDASEMVALTTLAFPGFFRRRTCEMGSYYGIRSEGELVAMGGERLMLDGYSEISGICTHPEHRGKGYAANIIWHLARNHRRDGIFMWRQRIIRRSSSIAGWDSRWRRMLCCIGSVVRIELAESKSWEGFSLCVVK
jgi:predicted GNAT family acetyltransferase